MATHTNLIERPHNGKQWYAQRWPWLLMLGPFLVVIAASYSGWIAFTRQDALVIDDYYKQGNAINQDLRRDRSATNLEMATTMYYDPNKGVLYGNLTSTGLAMAVKIRILLAHSTQPEKDITLETTTDQQGNFSANLPVLDQARWQVTVESAQRDWRLMSEWKWPQQRALELKADPPPAD